MATTVGDPTADLEKLAAELNGQHYATCIVRPPGRRTRLQVTNREVTSLTEAIYSDGEHYWWGWAERIAPVTDVAAAAEAIAKVLRAIG